MTTTQAMRLERRRRESERRAQAAKDAIIGILTGLLLVAAFGLAGTLDYPDEQRESAQWEAQGVTIVRDW